MSGTSEPGLILAECIALLAQLREEFAGDPVGEYQRLSLLALEREQLVSYAYREDILGQRLNRLVAPIDVLEVMRHAFVQLWRDEEAHTVLIRGRLVGDRAESLGFTRTTIEQTSGLLAGWSSALKHHVPRSSAPLRSLFVDGLAQGARLVGKLSPDLREELQHKSFRDFCMYNVDAEETAELCWHRMVELETELGGPDVEAFKRIAREEREHRMIFEIVAEVLDNHDWLEGDTTAQSLADAFGVVDERFVHPTFRSEKPNQIAGFGSGASVSIFDDSTQSHFEAIERALELLEDVAGKSVVVLSSWMMGYSTGDPSSVIDPRVVDAVVSTLQERGASVVLIDGRNLYSGLFSHRDVANVAEHFGISPACPILDATADVVSVESQPILGRLGLSRQWVEADVRISLVRLRSHPREHLHASTANLESLVSGSADQIFWQRRYDHSVAALAVAAVAPPHLAIIDAWEDCPDGLFGIMAGEHTVDPGRVYASTDALACDLIALRHTGSARSVSSPTIRRAMEWFGDSRSQIEVLGVDEDIAGWRNPYNNMVSGFLADLSYPVFGYLSLSGALFAPKMDEVFVEVKPLPLPLRVIRGTARKTLGLQPPDKP